MADSFLVGGRQDSNHSKSAPPNQIYSNDEFKCWKEPKDGTNSQTLLTKDLRIKGGSICRKSSSSRTNDRLQQWHPTGQQKTHHVNINTNAGLVKMEQPAITFHPAIVFKHTGKNQRLLWGKLTLQDCMTRGPFFSHTKCLQGILWCRNKARGNCDYFSASITLSEPKKNLECIGKSKTTMLNIRHSQLHNPQHTKLLQHGYFQQYMYSI